jgi:phage head maturation protease
MGCHATEADAQAQVDALYASEQTMSSAPTPAPVAPAKTARARQTRPPVNTALLEAGALRAAALKEGRTPAGAEFRRQTVPGGVARATNWPAQIRVATVSQDGKIFKEITGYASAYEQPYDMWDWAGPYREIVAAGAGQASLAAKPDVQYLINHGGLSLARTIGRSPTLTVWEDGHGLGYRALTNPLRDEVRNLVLAIEDGQITENSFAFMIDDGVWSDDFTEFRIQAYNINRGDVSAVNYGANPHTSIGQRDQGAPVATRTEDVPAAAGIKTAAREIDERGRAITELEAWLATAGRH